MRIGYGGFVSIEAIFCGIYRIDSSSNWAYMLAIFLYKY